MRHGDFPWQKYVVRIDAEGYHSAKSRVLRADEENPTIDFRLVATGQRGAVVLNANGTPAVGASVLIGTASKPAWIRDNRPDPSGRGVRVAPDRRRRSDFESTFKPTTLRCLCWGRWGSHAFPVWRLTALANEPVQIVLQPWARVEGTLRSRQSPLPDAMVQLDFAYDSGRNSPGVVARTDGITCKRKPTASGRFVFDRVPPAAEVVVAHYAAARTPRGPFITNGKSAQFNAAPGQMRTIALGGTGRTVVGRFQLKDEAWAADWEASIGSLGLTAEPAEADILYRPSPRFDIERDGSFRIEDVPPGPYRIAFQLLALKPESSLRLGPRAMVKDQNQKGMSGLMVGNITVPEAPEGADDQPVDVGTLHVGYVIGPVK